MAIGVADAERDGRLPGTRRDPFDRMLVAQAHDLTVDEVFDRCGVNRLW